MNILESLLSTKEIGLAAALLISIYFFLRHMQKESQENREYIKQLIDENNARVKEITDSCEKRLSENRQWTKETIESLGRTYVDNIERLLDQQDKLNTIVYGLKDEISKHTEYTRTLITTRTEVCQVEPKQGEINRNG